MAAKHPLAFGLVIHWANPALFGNKIPNVKIVRIVGNFGILPYFEILFNE